MNDFIIGEESFCLKLMERVPEPQAGECFLLYQTGAGIHGSMVIRRGTKYSSAAVRHGRYNKKVILSLRSLSYNENYRVVMTDVNFYFDVNVGISYELQDVPKYYFQGQIERDDIHHIIRDEIATQNQKWDASKSWQLQNLLETQIEHRLKQHEGVTFKVAVKVVPDKAALKMQESNRDKVVDIHVSGNEADKKIAINHNEKKIADSEWELKVQRLKEMAYMMQNFGDLGPIVNQYLEGDIDGEALYEYMIKARTNDMNMLNMAISTEMLTNEEILGKLSSILSDNRFVQSKQQLPEKEQLQIENEDEKANEGGDIEQESSVDGEFL